MKIYKILMKRLIELQTKKSKKHCKYKNQRKTNNNMKKNYWH